MYGAQDGGQAGVVAGPAAIVRAEVLDPLVARVEPADRPVLGLEQLVAEVGHHDPQAVLLDVVGLEPGVSGHPRRGPLPLVVGEPVAAREDRGVLAVDPPLDLLSTAGRPSCCKSAGSFLWYQAAAAYDGR